MFKTTNQQCEVAKTNSCKGPYCQKIYGGGGDIIQINHSNKSMQVRKYKMSPLIVNLIVFLNISI